MGVDAVDRARKAKVLQILEGCDGPARCVCSTYEGDTLRMEKIPEPARCDGHSLIHQLRRSMPLALAIGRNAAFLVWGMSTGATMPMTRSFTNRRVEACNKLHSCSLYLQLT